MPRLAARGSVHVLVRLRRGAAVVVVVARVVAHAPIGVEVHVRVLVRRRAPLALALLHRNVRRRELGTVAGGRLRHAPLHGHHDSERRARLVGGQVGHEAAHHLERLVARGRHQALELGGAGDDHQPVLALSGGRRGGEHLDHFRLGQHALVLLALLLLHLELREQLRHRLRLAAAALGCARRLCRRLVRRYFAAQPTPQKLHCPARVDLPQLEHVVDHLAECRLAAHVQV
mmetsp:Transcript_40622/g.118447  ORF Transcript_40622/g.118447 Transcript_40622/m.118447 type:complete len:231 (-) Transcript_40622:608-1300(-)